MNALAKKMGHGQRILVTGSRDWDDKSAIAIALATHGGHRNATNHYPTTPTNPEREAR